MIDMIHQYKLKIFILTILLFLLATSAIYTFAEERGHLKYADLPPTSLRKPLDAYEKGSFCASCHDMPYPLPPEEPALSTSSSKVYGATPMEPGLKRLTWDPGRDVGAFYSPKGDKIVWVTDRLGNWTIWVMNEDGSGKKQLTSESVISGWPSWSPDGSELAYWSWDPASNSCDIWKMMIDGSLKVRLTTDGNFKGAPKWSPRDERIAYTSELTGDMEVYVMNEDGSKKHQITEGHSPENFVETQIIWHPDGERLYWKVCIFPLPPSTVTIIPNDVAFVEIHMINVDTGDDKILTPKLHEAIHSVSHDGKKIAFISLRSSNYGLWVMDDDGAGQTRLTWDGQGDRAPQISPDGKSIVYWSLAYGFQTDILCINIDGSDKTRLTKSGYHDVYPSWSPYGNKIVFESDRTGNYDIWQISMDSSIDVDVEFEGCSTPRSVGRAFITIKPSINAKGAPKVEQIALHFDWNDEGKYIENLITVPYTFPDQNEGYQTEIEFSVPEDTELGYHFYNVKILYSKVVDGVEGPIRIYEHSAGDLRVGLPEQHQCEILYKEIETELEQLHAEAINQSYSSGKFPSECAEPLKGYFDFLVQPEAENYVKANDEFLEGKYLYLYGNYSAALSRFQEVKSLLKEGPSRTLTQQILSRLLFLTVLLPAMISILVMPVFLRGLERSSNKSQKNQESLVRYGG
ncbi:MAG: hypothetical protein NWF08_00300 [Candidatus Bathyarchaeota archaeon]|nr:hypothetical protein [Candidatus Bathyarchaeota archaeon]